MISHLTVMHALIGKMLWIEEVLASYGIKLIIEDLHSGVEKNSLVYGHDSASRSGYCLSLVLFEHLKDIDTVSPPYRTFFSLFLACPDEDTTDVGGPWLQLHFGIDQDLSVSIKLDRDGYEPDERLEAAFVEFPNGNKTPEQAEAVVRAMATYYLSQPI